MSSVLSRDELSAMDAYWPISWTTPCSANPSRGRSRKAAGEPGHSGRKGETTVGQGPMEARRR